MRSRLIVALLMSAALAHAESYQGLVKRYEREIKQQEHQLKSLKANLAEKQREASRWQQKAEEAKQQWNQAATSADRVKETVKAAEDEKHKTQTLADAAEWSATEHRLVADSSDGQLAYWVRELYAAKQGSASPRLTVVDRAPEYVAASLSHFSQLAHHDAEAATRKEAALRMQEMRWQSEERERMAELDRLRERQQSQWLKWQEAQRRRQMLVEEVAQLEQSQEALRVMLQELHDHRDHAMAARQGRSTESHALASLKGTLPWPAYGKITQNFGRQYSEELKQLQISNGIRIEAGANHPVRTIQPGKVLYANTFREYGQLVIVQHTSGLTSVYGGLGQTRVKEGDQLGALDSVGTTGEAGTFYFELRHEEQPVNPLVYLSPIHRSELSSRRTFE